MTENMYELLAKKNGQLMQTLDILSKDTLREKILSYLQLRPEGLQAPPGLPPTAAVTLTVDLPLNKSELAHYLNVNRSSLCRELTAMEKDGLLSVTGNRYTLFAS
jgi:cyclic nucleotide-binding domain protein